MRDGSFVEVVLGVVVMGVCALGVGRGREWGAMVVVGGGGAGKNAGSDEAVCFVIHSHMSGM
jgi:hypothetical protein